MRVDLTKIVDRYFGSLVCLILGLFNIGKEKGEVKTIVMMQFWGLGETVCTLPAIRRAKELYPDAKITVLTTTRVKDIYTGIDYIDDLEIIEPGFLNVLRYITSNIRSFDLAIDMEEYLNVSAIMAFFIARYRKGYSHGVRSMLFHEKVFYDDRKHVTYAFMDLVDRSVKDVDALGRLHVDEKDKKAVDALLKAEGLNKRLVGMVVTTAESARSRMWPHDRFAELADRLIEDYDVQVVIIGAPHEKELARNVMDMMKNPAVSTCGKTNVKQMFYLCSSCDLVISNDTGPMHIAAAMGTKTIGLFGPNLPERFGPFGKGNIGIYKGRICEYSPCINVHKGEVPDCYFSRNSEDYQKCMKNISVQDVLKEADKRI